MHFGDDARFYADNPGRRPALSRKHRPQEPVSGCRRTIRRANARAGVGLSAEAQWLPRTTKLLAWPPMRLVLANHSSYPRVGAGAEAQRLRRAFARRETGDLSAEGFLDVARDYSAEIMREQAEAGVELVTDGQVHWYDCIAHPTSRLQGTRVNGLIRLFDTNSYVRRPEITGSLSGRFGLVDDWVAASKTSRVPVKPVVTGPYTLARHSIAEAPVESLTLAYAEILADELRAFADAGAPLVQVDEPSLLKFPEDAPIVRRALERASGSAIKISLATYFGDASPILPQLLDMPADMLGLDLVYGPALVDALAKGVDRPIALGAIDGRNTKLDSDDVAKTVGRILEALERRGVEEVHLQPSSGLEHLPRDRAKRKLERMSEIAGLVR